jgi:hypothetical protein
MVIEGVLLHFSLLVTGNGLMSEVMKLIPIVLPEPVQKLLLLLWKFLTITAERLLGVICVVFVPEVPARFANQFPHF